MSDQALDWMVNTLHALPTSPEQQLVWCIDENALHGIPDLPHKHLQLITNRWDIAEQANANSLQVQFNDFDFSGHEDNSVDVFFLSCLKRKATGPSPTQSSMALPKAWWAALCVRFQKRWNQDLYRKNCQTHAVR